MASGTAKTAERLAPDCPENAPQSPVASERQAGKGQHRDGANKPAKVGHQTRRTRENVKRRATALVAGS